MDRDTFLSKFFRRLSIQLNYIPGGSKQLRLIFSLLSWLGIVEVGLLCARDIVLISLDDDSDWIYIFGDFAAPAGKFRKQATLIFLLYLCGGLYSALFLARTQNKVKYQEWAKIYSIFDSIGKKHNPNIGLTNRINWLTTRIEIIYSMSIVISLLLLSVVLTVTFPPQFIRYTLAHQLINIHGGYNCSSHWGVSYLLFPSYGYLLGQRMDKLTDQLDKFIGLTDYSPRHLMKRSTFMIDNRRKSTPRGLILKLTKQLKQLHKSCLFWSRISEPTFLISFINQALLLYLIFFVPMSTGFRFFLSVLGIFNFLSGQCYHFFAGIYTQKKVIIQSTGIFIWVLSFCFVLSILD